MAKAKDCHVGTTSLLAMTEVHGEGQRLPRRGYAPPRNDGGMTLEGDCYVAPLALLTMTGDYRAVLEKEKGLLTITDPPLGLGNGILDN